MAGFFLTVIIFALFYALVFQAFFCLLIKVSSPMLKNSSFASLPRLFLLCCQCLLLLTYSWKKPWMWNRLLENSSSFAAGKLDLVWQTNRIDSNPTKQQIKFASTSLFFSYKGKEAGKVARWEQYWCGFHYCVWLSTWSNFLALPWNTFKALL